MVKLNLEQVLYKYFQLLPYDVEQVQKSLLQNGNNQNTVAFKYLKILEKSLIHFKYDKFYWSFEDYHCGQITDLTITLGVGGANSYVQTLEIGQPLFKLLGSNNNLKGYEPIQKNSKLYVVKKNRVQKLLNKAKRVSNKNLEIGYLFQSNHNSLEKMVQNLDRENNPITTLLLNGYDSVIILKKDEEKVHYFANNETKLEIFNTLKERELATGWLLSTL